MDTPDKSAYDFPYNAISVNALALPEQLPVQMLDALQVNDQGVLKWTEEAKYLFMFRATCIKKTEAAARFKFHFVHNNEELTVKWYPCAEDDRPRSRRGILLITAPSLRGTIFLAAKERGTRNNYRIWLGKGRGFATRWDIVKSAGEADDNTEDSGKGKEVSKEESIEFNELPEWPEQQEQFDKDPEPLAETAFDLEVKSEGGENNGDTESVVLPSIEVDSDALLQQPLPTAENSDSNSMRGIPTPSESTPAPSARGKKSRPRGRKPQESHVVSIDIYFVDEAGHTVRIKPWDKCFTLQKFFVQVAASRIVESMHNEFALLARIDGMEVTMTKHDEDDFESLKTMIVAYMAHCGDAKHGVVEITRLTEYVSGC